MLILGLVIFHIVDLRCDVADDERIEHTTGDDGKDAANAFCGVARGNIAVPHCEHLRHVESSPVGVRVEDTVSGHTGN